MRIPYISLIAGAAVALGGCAYGGVGLGYGNYGGYGYGPYGSYGYSSNYCDQLGYGTNYRCGYGSRYGLGYGYYGMPYWGWYDNYYYPGTGLYVYDVYRRPHVMSTTQRSYWSSRSPALRTSSTTTRSKVRPNWSGFDRRTTAAERRAQRRAVREQRREDRRD